MSNETDDENPFSVWFFSASFSVNWGQNNQKKYCTNFISTVNRSIGKHCFGFDGRHSSFNNITHHSMALMLIFFSLLSFFHHYLCCSRQLVILIKSSSTNRKVRRRSLLNCISPDKLWGGSSSLPQFSSILISFSFLTPLSVFLPLITFIRHTSVALYTRCPKGWSWLNSLKHYNSIWAAM